MSKCRNETTVTSVERRLCELEDKLAEVERATVGALAKLGAIVEQMSTMVSTRALGILDEHGRTVVMLSSTPDSGGMIGLCNPAGVPVAALVAGVEGGVLRLADSDGTCRVSALTVDDCGRLDLCGEHEVVSFGPRPVEAGRR